MFNTFGEYVNLCSVPLMGISSIDVVKRVIARFFEFGLKHKKYRYYGEAWAHLNEYFAIVLLNPPTFPMLDALKDQTGPLTATAFFRTGTARQWLASWVLPLPF